jgi:NADPH2:quinone reductase
MKAWRVTSLGEPKDVLALHDVPEPELGPGQVAVRVLASAANFPDVLMCRGLYQVKPALPFTPGIELCGSVVAVGTGVTGLAAGDRVSGSTVLPDGGFAEVALLSDPASGQRAAPADRGGRRRAAPRRGPYHRPRRLRRLGERFITGP